MNRRRLLQSGLLAALGAALHPRRADGAPRERVIVIGAGMAGMTAASELRRQGFQVTVLEARDRIGGRVHTDRSLGTPVDMGASWIHGVDGNPLTALAQRLRIPCGTTDYDDVTVHDEDGSLVPPGDLAELHAAWEELYAEVEGIASEGGQDVSVMRAVTRVIAGEELDPLEQRYLDWRLQTEVLNAAASLEDLSLTGDGGDSFGGGDCLPSGGYEQIVKAVGAGVDVKLGCVVTGVEVRPAGVRVHVASARAKAARTFDAERVVVTLPLGVLKASAAAGGVAFDPPLPKAKRAAIDRLGMGEVNKVALRFPNVFWPGDRHFIGDLGGAHGGFPVYMNHRRHGGPPVLVAFWGGRGSRRREAASDDAIAAEAMGRLRKLFGRKIPDPVSVAASRWRSDPYALGSYSFIPVGGSSRDYDVLAEPVGDRLFFAGEATIVGHSATVHGAHISGMREAERIVDRLS